MAAASMLCRCPLARSQQQPGRAEQVPGGEVGLSGRAAAHPRKASVVAGP